MRKILLPREWTDAQIADFAAKYCASYGAGDIKFERAPIQDPETAAINAELAQLQFKPV